MGGDLKFSWNARGGGIRRYLLRYKKIKILFQYILKEFLVSPDDPVHTPCTLIQCISHHTDLEGIM